MFEVANPVLRATRRSEGGRKAPPRGGGTALGRAMHARLHSIYVHSRVSGNLMPQEANAA